MSDAFTEEQQTRLRAYRGSREPINNPSNGNNLGAWGVGVNQQSQPRKLDSAITDEERYDLQHEVIVLKKEISVLERELSGQKERCRVLQETCAHLEDQCDALRSAGVDGLRHRVEAGFNEVQQMRERLNQDLASFDMEKREFQRGLMAKVDTIVQAYKDKMDSELQKQKDEAVRANEALAALRKSIQSEGIIDAMAMSPSLMSPSLKALNSNVVIHPETNAVVREIANDLLSSLINLQDRIEAEGNCYENYSKTIQRFVTESTQKGFEGLVSHFTRQVEMLRESNEISMKELDREKKELREELKLQIHLNDRQLKELSTQHQQEVSGLKDELMMHRNKLQGAGSQLLLNTIEEYRTMAKEARDEASQTQILLEQERDRMANVCIKLKGSLKKRNEEFETAIMKKADDLVRHYKMVADTLQCRLNEKTPGDASISLTGDNKSKILSLGEKENNNLDPKNSEKATQQHYPSNFVKSVTLRMLQDQTSQKAAHGVGKLEFEKEVLDKTQELIAKYRKAV